MGNYSLIDELHKYLTDHFPEREITHRRAMEKRHRFQLRKSSKPRMYVNVIFGTDFLQKYELKEKRAKAFSFLDQHRLPQTIKKKRAQNTIVTIVVNLSGVCLEQPPHNPADEPEGGHYGTTR